MTRILYDLAAADPASRFSPHCWRVRLALVHKGLEVTTRPCRFTDKDAIAFAETDKLPVLVDGTHVVTDSWAILEYLADAYPDGPALFGAPEGRAQARFFRAWTDTVVQAGLAPMIVSDIHDRLDAADQAYFRESREARFGQTLEALAEERPQRLPAWRDALEPMRRTVAHQPFIAGEQPMVADILIYAALLWVRHGSDLEALAADDPILAWRERMDGAFEHA